MTSKFAFRYGNKFTFALLASLIFSLVYIVLFSSLAGAASSLSVRLKPGSESNTILVSYTIENAAGGQRVVAKKSSAVHASRYEIVSAQGSGVYEFTGDPSTSYTFILERGGITAIERSTSTLATNLVHTNPVGDLDALRQQCLARGMTIGVIGSGGATGCVKTQQQLTCESTGGTWGGSAGRQEFSCSGGATSCTSAQQWDTRYLVCVDRPVGVESCAPNQVWNSQYGVCMNRSSASGNSSASSPQCPSGQIAYSPPGGGDEWTCLSQASYCTTALGGTWSGAAGSAPAGCAAPNKEKACALAGLRYLSDTGTCTGSTTYNCDSLPVLGGVRSSCQQAKTAAASGGDASVSAGVCGDGGSFLGLPTWYKYLKTKQVENGRCEVEKFCFLANETNGCTSSSIPLVLLAIIEIITRIGAIVAVVFVVIGGFKFVTSQGEPDGVKGARNTIINAIIGLAVALIATPIIAFIGERFGG